MSHQVGQLDPAGPLDGGSGDGEQDDSRSVDELVLGPEASPPTRRLHQCLLAVTVLCTITALAMISGLDSREPGALELLSTPLNILVLGDSSADPEACSTCSSYVDQSAAAWSQRSGRRVRLDRKTVPSDVAAPSMPTLVESLRSDPDIRDSVSEADVILLAIGSGDVAPTAATSCRAERQAPCPRGPRREVPPKLGLMDHRDRHHPRPPPGDPSRGHSTTNLRLTPAEPCRADRLSVAAAHAAACVNVYDQARTDELLVDPGSDPQHPQLTQHGHDIVAAQLIATGITP